MTKIIEKKRVKHNKHYESCLSLYIICAPKTFLNYYYYLRNVKKKKIRMDSFLMFLNINCHKQRLFPEIGVGVIPIVVSPVNTKNGAMECLCYKAHAMVDI